MSDISYISLASGLKEVIFVVNSWLFFPRF